MQRFKNPFSQENQPAKQIKRNAFDLSHQNNLTMQMGVLYPCLCQEVIPGDTFKIDTAFGIRMLPLLFPIQTKIRVDLHYFYVRNRNLWDDWQNFITSSNDVYSFPLLSPSDQQDTGTSSLYDYLGLPTRSFFQNMKEHQFTSEDHSTDRIILNELNGNYSFGLVSEEGRNLQSDGEIGEYYPIKFNNSGIKTLTLSPSERFTLQIHGLSSQPSKSGSVIAAFLDNHGNNYNFLNVEKVDNITSGSSGLIGSINLTFRNISSQSQTLSLDAINSTLVLVFLGSTEVVQFSIVQCTVMMNTFSYTENDYKWSTSSLKVSALPFRAYESIYNSFYRDSRNNPLKINGVVTPNKYVTNTKGGFDSTGYRLYRRNWEQDAFTTCLPQPQQGPAPVIGMSASGMATMQDADGKLYQVKLITDSSGDRIVNFETNQDVPSSIKQTALNLVNNGFTINDFRNANSLQRWLECNYRNGLKYKDQIASHFGVDIQYATLDMPEFLGGVSQFINVDQINQMSETQENPLGSYAGQGSCIGKQSHTINKYCDEHGFIIGIISINPVPVYSQNLPKHFLKTGQLDYYFPEFGHIGYQPITYNEVCPLQAMLNGSGNQVLGYQRPWYEYLQSFDEIHGLFRTDFKDFVLQRQFKELPSLNPDFLTISESQLNDVFAVQSSENADRFLGQIHFNIIAKRPIPRYGIPKLE